MRPSLWVRCNSLWYWCRLLVLGLFHKAWALHIELSKLRGIFFYISVFNEPHAFVILQTSKDKIKMFTKCPKCTCYKYTLHTHYLQILKTSHRHTHRLQASYVQCVKQASLSLKWRFESQSWNKRKSQLEIRFSNMHIFAWL